MHFFFADAAFLDVIDRSCADYLIWHTPFKHAEYLESNVPRLPTASVYKVGAIDVQRVHYDPGRMVSTEV